MFWYINEISSILLAPALIYHSCVLKYSFIEIEVFGDGKNSKNQDKWSDLLQFLFG